MINLLLKDFLLSKDKLNLTRRFVYFSALDHAAVYFMNRIYNECSFSLVLFLCLSISF